MKVKLVCIALGLGGLVGGAAGIFLLVALALTGLDAYASFAFLDTLAWHVSKLLPPVAFAGGLLLGWALFRWYSCRKGIVWEFGPRARIAAWIVLVLYLLTWALGGPMVQSANTRWAMNEWKKACEVPDRGAREDGLPSIHTYVTVPILPFVVVSYHEYRIWRLAGAGGLDIQLWYVTGVKRLDFLVTWRS